MKLIPTLLLGTAAFTMQAATTINLATTSANNCNAVAGVCTTNGNNAALGGNFIVQQISPQSTGTGVIDSFLRVQDDPTEQGYNTSNGTPYSDKGGNFTRALALTEVPKVTINGTVYRQFLLDINQNGNDLINLNQIEILQSFTDPTCPAPATTCATTVSGGTFPVLSFPSGVTEIFQMSNNVVGSDFTILMNYALNAGSGSGDMFLYVRDDKFLAANGGQVILYSQFGNPPGANATNDGFEEWSVLKGANDTCVGACIVNTPEPGSVVLFGTVLIGVCQILRKRVSAARV